jgi:ZIP family zinc transporter
VAPVHVAFLVAVAAAAATMLGWVLVAAKRTWTPRSVGIALLLSAAAMLVISAVELLPPGLLDPETRGRTVLLVALGLALVPVLGAGLTRMFPAMGAAHAASVLVMLSIALHNVPEGTVAFAATIVSLRAGLVTALAIALHNIPEGMAVSTSVLAAGGSKRRALAYTAVSMLGEIAGAVTILALGRSMSESAATGLLAVVGGIMISLSLTQLIPTGVRLVRSTGTSLPESAPASAH